MSSVSRSFYHAFKLYNIKTMSIVRTIAFLEIVIYCIYIGVLSAPTSMIKSLLTLLFIFTAAAASFAQDTLPNGGFEIWHGGFVSPGPGTGHGVGCCGVALAVPQTWGIPEQLMGMPVNQFVYKEEDTAYIHSGGFCARFYTNITSKDSAGDFSRDSLLLIPGRVTCAGIVGLGRLSLKGDPYQTIASSSGINFTDTPRALNFYMLMSHDVPDTGFYAYAFTRWDSVNHREDTLASHMVEIADAGPVQSTAWQLFSDTIHYTMPGLPDTLHLIFYGGRNGDSSKVSNITWLDDISFYYVDGPRTGIVHLGLDDAITLYPNPSAASIQVRIDDYMVGYSIALYDLTGSRLMQQTLTTPLSTISTEALPDGVYLYRILDRGSNEVKSNKLTIAK